MRPVRWLLAAMLMLAPALSPLAAVAASPPPPAQVQITIAPGSIAVSGAPESGAAELLVSAARSLREPSAVLVRLKPGVSVQELIGYLASNMTGQPATIEPYGAIVFNREVAPGASAESEVWLAPGTYVALDGEGEKSSGWSHTSFTVSPSPAPPALPAAEAVERTKGLAFAGPRTLHRGELVRFENDGPGPLMDIAFPARSRADAERLASDLLNGHQRAAEALVASALADFAGTISGGASQQETITAPDGWYVQACFLETRGRPDTRLGMERVIRIVG